MTTTILIVDDHPSFRASARAILEADGFDVVGEVEDGAAALDAVAQTHPDVLLLDVQLPDMTGFEVCTVFSNERNDNPWLTAAVAVTAGLSFVVAGAVPAPDGTPSRAAPPRPSSRSRATRPTLASRRPSPT